MNSLRIEYQNSLRSPYHSKMAQIVQLNGLIDVGERTEHLVFKIVQLNDV